MRRANANAYVRLLEESTVTSPNRVFSKTKYSVVFSGYKVISSLNFGFYFTFM